MSRRDRHPMLELEARSETVYAVSDLLIEQLSQRRIWIFDLEATGLDTRLERVTQIAGIPLEGGRLLEDDAFVQFVNPGPGVEIPEVVQDLTGITLDMLADAPALPQAWDAHLRAAEGADFWIGQSVFEFDVPLLLAEFERHGMPPELPPILDSVVVATWLLGEPTTRWSTSALLQHFEVDIEGLRRHDALDDVKILGRILLPMLDAIRESHDDRIAIPPGRPLEIRRHPPVTGDED